MDTRKLTEILRATIDPNQRQQAEEQLSQIHKIIGFAPSLLQVVMSNNVSIPIRQAGVVYLKNLITTGWKEKDSEDGEPIPFSVHEQDRAMIRDIIIEAIVQSPEIIRVQLCVCLKAIIKNDFPACWTQVVDKIHIYLQGPEPSCWMGALLCLYQLIKCYEYNVGEKRAPLIEAMNLLLPMMYNLMVSLQADQSIESVLIQKQILKCFFGLIKYILPMDLITKEVFTKWMEVLRVVMETPVPEHTLQVDEDERMELPWWKCKKWAVHTLHRLFERYGSPVNTREEYVQFAEWYLATFTAGILEVLLRVLDQYRNKMYVSPRVLQQSLSYVDQCVTHAHSWKLLKPHMFAIIQDVLFPLMSYSDADEELWFTDPHEYIRIKFDIFEDFVSPVTAAQTLLISCCRKRKEMLEHTMHFCMQVLTGQAPDSGPRQRDGALHMMGTLNDLLLKKKVYKGQVETLISQYVLPEYRSHYGYMRARACWVLHSFATVHFKNEALLVESVHITINALLNDTELPVKVEAAIALQTMLSSQEKTHALLEPQVTAVASELLKVIRETENDNVANVLQKIVPLYTEQLMSMAFEIIEHLATTFSKVVETDSGSDEKAITAMGLLNTMETVLNVMENNPEIMAQMEKTVLRVVGHILHHNILEYYEEALGLLFNLTAKSISEDMWKVLELIYKVFEKDGYDYFTDIMPILHNYITVDTNAFLSNENHMLAIFNIIKVVLNWDSEDEAEIHAAKLLEVMVLQCSGKIDNCLPSFIELVLNRLTRKVKTSELRTMLLQVLIAVLYYNPHLLFTILNKLQESVPNASITQHFIKQWIHDVDCFMGLHDRKLCVLGICTLLEMGPQRPNLDEVVGKIMPSCLVLFEGLKRAYELKAEGDDESSSDEEEEGDDEEVLSSDEDDIEDMNNEYLENLARMASKNSAAQGVNLTAKIEEYDSDDDEEDYEPDETPIECYTTPLDEKDCPVDEYIRFKNTITGLSTSEPALYHALTCVLNEEQQKQLNSIFVLADQRKAQQDSKRIEQSGALKVRMSTCATHRNLERMCPAKLSILFINCVANPGYKCGENQDKAKKITAVTMNLDRAFRELQYLSRQSMQERPLTLGEILHREELLEQMEAATPKPMGRSLSPTRCLGPLAMGRPRRSRGRTEIRSCASTSRSEDNPSGSQGPQQRGRRAPARSHALPSVSHCHIGTAAARLRNFHHLMNEPRQESDAARPRQRSLERSESPDLFYNPFSWQRRHTAVNRQTRSRSVVGLRSRPNLYARSQRTRSAIARAAGVARTIDIFDTPEERRARRYQRAGRPHSGRTDSDSGNVNPLEEISEPMLRFIDFTAEFIPVELPPPDAEPPEWSLDITAADFGPFAVGRSAVSRARSLAMMGVLSQVTDSSTDPQ